jgi:hypothetical protein
MFLLGLSMLLLLYIPQFPTCCREYVGEIYELQHYYHPPILFLSSFSFSFFPFFLFLFLTLLYTNYHRWTYLSFYQNIFIWDLVLKDLLKGFQQCNQNLIWFFDFWVIYFLASSNNGAHHWIMVLVGLLRWHACMLRELLSWELLYRSYRLPPVSPLFTPTTSLLGISNTFVDWT